MMARASGMKGTTQRPQVGGGAHGSSPWNHGVATDTPRQEVQVAHSARQRTLERDAVVNCDGFATHMRIRASVGQTIHSRVHNRAGSPRGRYEDLRCKSEGSRRETIWSGRPGSNRRPRPWQGRALPTELRPRRVQCSRSTASHQTPRCARRTRPPDGATDSHAPNYQGCQRPELPKPPTPRAVSGSANTSRKLAVVVSMITS